MKKLILILIPFCITFLSNAQHGIFNYYKDKYYVSNDGNDSNSGKYPWKAWKTLTKVNATTFSAGDRIAFKAGDEWNGTITVGQSGTSGNPITFKSYGTGAKPIIYGSEVITGSWTVHSGNIYKLTGVDETNIAQLFIDNERATLARYPNGQYATIDKPLTSNTTFASTALNHGIDYTGATVWVKTQRYTLQPRVVASSRVDTLVLARATSSQIKATFGYWICDKLEFLDAAGEWYYDNPNNTLYFWTPNGDTPANYEIRISTTDYGVNTNAKEYITIKNLEFQQQGKTAIQIPRYSKYITVDNIESYDADLSGVFTDNLSENVTVTNSKIYRANSTGIWTSNHKPVITNNYIEDIGHIANLNKGTQFYNLMDYSTPFISIFAMGRMATIERNTVINSGYHGIAFDGKNSSIRYNYVNGANLYLDDGGALYCYVGTRGQDQVRGTVMEYNTALNSRGTTPSVYTGVFESNPAPFAGGIYLDGYSHGITVRNNYISNVQIGISMSMGDSVNINNNTIHDAQMGIWGNPASVVSTAAGLKADTVKIYNNTIYQSDRLGTYTYFKANSYGRMIYQQGTDAQDSLIKWNYNKYYAKVDTTQGVFPDKTVFASFSHWKSLRSQDLASTFDGVPHTAGRSSMLAYNETSVPVTWYFNNATTVKDINGDAVAGTSKSIAAYSSEMLTAVGANAIQRYQDAVPPTMTAFTIPETGTVLEVAISSFTTSADATEFIITESATVPSLGNTNWVETIPTTYTFATGGGKRLYAWCRDAAGNVSTALSDSITLTVSQLIAKTAGWYEFEETSGTTLVDANGNYNGTISTNMLINQSNNVMGKSHVSSAQTLSRNVLADNDVWTLGGNFALSYWVRPTNLSENKYLISKSSEYMMYVSSDRRIHLYIYSGGGTSVYKYFYTTATNVIAINNTYNIVVNVTDYSAAIYVNGSGIPLSTSHAGSFSAMSNTSNSVVIGNTIANATWVGDIGQLIIFNDDLTEGEIEQLSNGVYYSDID